MEQSGEYLIKAPRDRVWAAINNPQILKDCIEGCQSLEQTGDNAFEAAVNAQIGAVSALFKVELGLEDVDPPNSYTIKVNVKDGSAGFGEGIAQVGLSDQEGETLLRYSVDAKVGDKLAQIDSKLFDSAARQVADDFFTRFSAASERTGAEVFTGGHGAEHFGEHTSEDGGSRPTPTVEPRVERGSDGSYEPSRQWVIWAIMFGVLLLAVVLTI